MTAGDLHLSTPLEAQKLDSANKDAEVPFTTVQLTPPPNDTVATTDLPVAHNPELSFSLGVEPSALPTRQELREQHPELESLMKDVAGMVGSGTDTPINFSDMPDLVPSSIYKFDALQQTIAKYGVDRVQEMFDTLKQISPTGLSAYREELRFSNTNSNRWPKTNERLYNMVELCEPGRLEAVKDLVEKMRSEGYTQTFDLSDMNPAKINLLSNDQGERGAFIELENLEHNGMSVSFFFKDHPEIDKTTALPSELLAAFRNNESSK